MFTALVAQANADDVSIWHMLSHDMDYHDLGGTYFPQLAPDRTARQAVRRLHQLAFQDTLTPAGAA